MQLIKSLIVLAVGGIVASDAGAAAGIFFAWIAYVCLFV